MTYLMWSCPECFDCRISIDKRHHEMNTCKCGATSVDYEVYGLRTMSNKYTEVEKSFKEIDMNFYDELLLCYKEQGFQLEKKLIWICRAPIFYIDTEFIRDLEDEMLAELAAENMYKNVLDNMSRKLNGFIDGKIINALNGEQTCQKKQKLGIWKRLLSILSRNKKIA